MGGHYKAHCARHREHSHGHRLGNHLLTLNHESSLRHEDKTYSVVLETENKATFEVWRLVGYTQFPDFGYWSVTV